MTEIFFLILAIKEAIVRQAASWQTISMLKVRCAGFVASVAMDGGAPESSPGRAR